MKKEKSMAKTDEIQKAKDSAGKAALDFIKDGMVVGLGTGSTASCFIEHLIEKCKSGLKIKAVATSTRSTEQAKKGGIPFLDINEITSVDITVDGADEIDHSKRMIKGGGGALMREKIIASMSKEVVIVVDESKYVKKLGKFPVPVEIIPFAYKATISHLEKKGYNGKLRLDSSNQLYKTDNGNYIYDIHFPNLIDDPEAQNQQLVSIPGIVETGFFFHLANRLIIGYKDGQVEIKN